MSTYRSRAEQRVAEDFSIGQELMCGANGCPHRWSVDAGGGRLCSHHAWAPSHLWPQITQEQQDAVTERAARYKPPTEARRMTQGEKVKTLRALRDLVASPAGGGRKEWAHRIVERSEAGEVVSPLVLLMARAVVSKHARRSE